MKPLKSVASVLMMLLVTTGMMAQDMGMYNFTKTNMTISGTSTVHDWTADVGNVYGSVAIDKNLSANVGSEMFIYDAIENVSVKIPVKSIKSHKSSMDDKIYDALNAGQHKYITFSIDKVKTLTVTNKSKGTFVAKVTGKMTVAGQTKNVDLTIKGQKLNGSAFSFSGAVDMKMTDFGVSPPTAMMGTIKSGDAITVSFDVTVMQEKGSASIH